MLQNIHYLIDKQTILIIVSHNVCIYNNNYTICIHIIFIQHKYIIISYLFT